MNEDGNAIAPWAMYGPPSRSKLKWPKHRDPLPENLKLWRDTVRNIFCGESGLYPRNLGAIVRPVVRREMLMGSSGTCHDILCQYPSEYNALLGKQVLGDEK